MKVAVLPPSESSGSNSIIILTAQLSSKILVTKVVPFRPYLIMILNLGHAGISEDYARVCIKAIQRGANAEFYLAWPSSELAQKYVKVLKAITIKLWNKQHS